MSTISTFGTFTTARLALYVAQASMNITGNNISNINTPGYTRQKGDQVSMYLGGTDRYASKLDLRIGSGAILNGVSQLRDPYLDIQYRNENSKVGSMTAKLEGLNRLATVLDEVGKGEDEGGVLELQYNDLLKQLQNLAAQGAGIDSYDSNFRSSVNSFLTMVRDYAGDLQEQRAEVEDDFREDLDEVNSILRSIRNLNAQIRKTNVYGGDALELKDQRNNLIDQLSEYVAIDVTYGSEDLGDGMVVEKLTISLAGNDQVPVGDPQMDERLAANKAVLVDGIYCTQMSITQVPGTDAGGNPVMKEDENFNISLSKLVDDKYRVQVLDSQAKTVQNGATPPADLVFDGPTALQDAQAQAGALNQAAPVDPTGKVRVTYQVVADRRANTADVTATATPAITDKTDRAQFEAALAEFNKNNTDDNVSYQVVDDPANAGQFLIQKTTKESIYTIQEITQTLSTGMDLFDNTLYGALQSERELLTEAGEFCTQEQLDTDPNADTKRGIPYYQYALDAMAQKFATIMNTANDGTLHPAAEKIDPATAVHPTPGYTYGSAEIEINGVKKTFLTETDNNGNEYFVVTDDCVYKNQPADRKFTRAADGSAVLVNPGTDLKDHLSGRVHGYEKDPNGAFVHEGDQNIPDPRGGALISNSGDGNDTDGITALNISVAQQWSTGAVRVVQDWDSDGSTASGNLTHLLSELWTNEHDFNPQDTNVDAASGDTYFQGTMQNFMSNMWDTLAIDAKTTDTMLDNYSTTTGELLNDRDAVSGVDLNEETMNLIQYQKAYSAACRLVTTFDEMLEKLINGTAI